MRRLWLPLGFVLGALFVHALTHRQRHMAGKWQRFVDGERQSLAEMKMDIAVDGIAYNSGLSTP